MEWPKGLCNKSGTTEMMSIFIIKLRTAFKETKVFEYN
jgi:hypothetical protein